MITPLIPTELSVVRAMISLARATRMAIDNSEEFEGDHGRCHCISGQDFDDMVEAIDALDELPVCRPGHTMAGQSAKAVIDEVVGCFEAANGHLSRMVDELRELAQDAKQAMTALQQAAIPDESQEGVPAIIPPDAFRRFVDAHAQLCFRLHQLGHDTTREHPQRYEITSIKYLAGELTLRSVADGEVPQSFESGQVVTLQEVGDGRRHRH